MSNFKFITLVAAILGLALEAKEAFEYRQYLRLKEKFEQ